MTILEPTSSAQSFSVWPRDNSFESGASYVSEYQTRVIADGGIIEAATCLRTAIDELLGAIITLVNENTNEQVTTTITSSSNSNGYLNITLTTAAGELYEGGYYILTLKDGQGNIVFRGRVFCTSQEPTEYTINDGEFTFAPALDNQFIIV
jgi:hypothetical protein